VQEEGGDEKKAFVSVNWVMAAEELDLETQVRLSMHGRCMYHTKTTVSCVLMACLHVTCMFQGTQIMYASCTCITCIICYVI
jgi:hypothetical protein